MLCLPLCWLRLHLERPLRNLYFFLLSFDKWKHEVALEKPLVEFWWGESRSHRIAGSSMCPLLARFLGAAGFWPGREKGSLFCLQHIAGAQVLSPFWHQDFSCLRTSLGDTHLESQHMGDWGRRIKSLRPVWTQTQIEKKKKICNLNVRVIKVLRNWEELPWLVKLWDPETWTGVYFMHTSLQLYTPGKMQTNSVCLPGLAEKRRLRMTTASQLVNGGRDLTNSYARACTHTHTYTHDPPYPPNRHTYTIHTLTHTHTTSPLPYRHTYTLLFFFF